MDNFSDLLKDGWYLQRRLKSEKIGPLPSFTVGLIVGRPNGNLAWYCRNDEDTDDFMFERHSYSLVSNNPEEFPKV
jgi:hypothetical protein